MEASLLVLASGQGAKFVQAFSVYVEQRAALKGAVNAALRRFG
jgi:hypothetical protein